MRRGLSHFLAQNHPAAYGAIPDWSLSKLMMMHQKAKLAYRLIYLQPIQIHPSRHETASKCGDISGRETHRYLYACAGRRRHPHQSIRRPDSFSTPGNKEPSCFQLMRARLEL
jgi:hypothetical protein